MAEWQEKVEKGIISREMPPDFVKGATGGTKAKTARPIPPITGEYIREQFEGMGAWVQGEIARCYTSFSETFQSIESTWQEKFEAAYETTAKLSDKTNQHSEADIRDEINYFWWIKTSNDVLNKFTSKNFQASKLSTYDFSTLYTTLPHHLISSCGHGTKAVIQNHKSINE